MDTDTICKTQLSSTYNLRPRRSLKHKETRPDTQNVRNSKRRQQTADVNCFATRESDLNEDETENSSQVSVSMLQGCYRNFENDFSEVFEIPTNPNFEMATCYGDEELKNAWDATGSSQKNGLRFTVEECTQTEFPALLSVQRGNETGKDAEFVGCVVKLKAILSSKDKRTDTNLLGILQNVLKSSSAEGSSIQGADNTGSTSSKENVGYLRSYDTDKFFRETVGNLLQELKYLLEDDFLEAAGCWRVSVYEMAIDLLNEAVDCDPKVQEMVEYFLCEVLESISNDGGRSKNLLLESKAVLIMSFCRSTPLSFAATSFIIGELKRLSPKSQGCFSYAEKLCWSNFVKNSYFLLRILEVSLDSIMSKLKKEEPENIPNKKGEVKKNFNVLEVWKKHGREEEMSSEERAVCQWKLIVSKWFSELDEILSNCVNYFPVSATAMERCKQLVKKILKICYPDEKGGEHTKTLNFV